MKKTTTFPPGWDEPRVQQALAHYESQNEDDAVAEGEAAFADEPHTVIEVPTDLVPTIRELIAKHRKQHHAKHAR